MRKYLLIIVFVVFLVINAYAKTTTIKSKTPSSSAVKEFSIDEDMHKNNQQLIKLILNTESMDDEERQYWFDIMPSMTKEQVSRLFNILETERKKLEELDKKYQKEIDALNGKNTPHKDIILLVYKSPLEETWKMYTPIKEKDFIPSSMSLISFKDNLVLTPSLEKYILSTLDNKEKYRFYSSKVYSELQHIDYLMFEYYLQKKIIRLNNLLSKLAQYKDIDEKSAIAYLQCKEYILILDEDKSKFINFYLDKNNSKVFSMTFDWVYFLKKSITDKRLLNNYSELSKENNEKWLKKSEALQTQPIIAEYVCSINSIDENHQFRHFLKDKVITRIKDTHYKQLNRLYFQNDDGSAILEQYNKTYKAYKEDSRSDYNDSKIQLSRTNGEKALEYGAYTILKLLKESEKYFGFNYLRYQDLIKNIHKDIKYIYINDRDDNVSRFIEREINDRYIANVISERDGQFPAFIKKSQEIIGAILLVAGIFLTIYAIVNIYFRKLLRIDNESSLCEKYLLLCNIKIKMISWFVVFFLTRNLRYFIVRRLSRKIGKTTQVNHDLFIKDGAVIAKDDLSEYFAHILKHTNKIPIEVLDIQKIAHANGGCAFHILEQVSPEKFCFFVPITEKETIENRGVFQDSLIIYYK